MKKRLFKKFFKKIFSFDELNIKVSCFDKCKAIFEYKEIPDWFFVYYFKKYQILGFYKYTFNKLRDWEAEIRIDDGDLYKFKTKLDMILNKELPSEDALLEKEMTDFYKKLQRDLFFKYKDIVKEIEEKYNIKIKDNSRQILNEIYHKYYYKSPNYIVFSSQGLDDEEKLIEIDNEIMDKYNKEKEKIMKRYNLECDFYLLRVDIPYYIVEE